MSIKMGLRTVSNLGGHLTILTAIIQRQFGVLESEKVLVGAMVTARYEYYQHVG